MEGKLKVLTCTMLIMLVTMEVEVVHGGDLYDFRVLRNPGLVSDTATTFEICISKCLSMASCSAISYQPSTGACLKSTCGALDLFQNNGWRTYIVAPKYFLEKRDHPSPDFEWMLTDACYNQSLGYVNGPSMTVSGFMYAPSMSPYFGNAVNISGSTTTDFNTIVNNPSLSKPMTVMIWVNFDVAGSTASLMEFYGSGTNGLSFMYSYPYVQVTSSYCTSSCGSFTAYYIVGAGVWNNFAFVHSNGILRYYMNSSIIASFNPSYFTNSITWDTVRILRAGGRVRFQCARVFYNELTADQIKAASQSCYLGRARLSQ